MADKSVMRIVLAFSGLLVMTASAQAIVIRHDRTDASYLNYGANAAFNSVGRFTVDYGSGQASASGTLIGSQWVLTAAHVTDGATSLNFTIGGQEYTADGYAMPSGWVGDLSAGNDLALVRLSQPVTHVAAATRYAGRSESGQGMVMVGFGTTGTGLTGGIAFDARKRAADNVVDLLTAYGASPDLLYSDFDNPLNRNDNAIGSSRPLSLEGLIAPGDSGGAAFIKTRKGYLLAGVHSFGSSWDGLTNSDYGDVAGHTRVSSWNSWIDQVMLAFAPTTFQVADYLYGGEPYQFELTSIPEPVGLLPVAAGLLALARRRR